ncbi:MAG TPA: hypothetical protein VGZ26_05820 [Pirellulales bacterium]|jgi:hypothetical protein|nr:hypothetical protein [Pirellulales bacterium]
MLRTAALLNCLILSAGIARSMAADLSQAVVVTPANLSGPEKKAVGMLLDEVQKRTQIRWRVASAWPMKAEAVIAVGPTSALAAFAGPLGDELKQEPAGKAEGFRIRGKRSTVLVAGNDERGVLFGIGWLLRHMHMNPAKITIDDNLNVTTAPAYPLRGHQLGYRPKTNSYDAWDLAQWEQYYRDLAVFGCNAVELIPPRSDDDRTSPHFPLPPIEMMVGMSRVADDYGLDVWIWYPAMDKDYSDPKTVEFALKEWGEVYQKLPRIDVIFVPGGDPGHTQPKYLMALLEKQTELLHKYHPKAQMWMSPQSFNASWMEEFYGIMKTEPAWLSGIVFGPQNRGSLKQLRAAIPQKYPIRHYPDITHSRQCQYPVPDWDLAHAVTSSRECINPRPLGEATIFRLLEPYTIGFLTYSEGCNDDVNKAVWSGLGWNPDAKVIDILRDFGRYYIGDRYADDFAQGLLALERNWQGPLLTNEGVYVTLEQFQSMEKSASPEVLKNWRFQQALYRAYYDAYVRARLIYETELEERAMDQLRLAGKTGALPAMAEAEKILDSAETRVATDWRSRVFELADALFASIKMQTSVSRYKAISVDRGATLDTLDAPLNDRLWLKERFAALRDTSIEAERLAGIDEIVNWTNPGPGGFYDDLGKRDLQPHLVVGPGFEKDPAFLESSHTGFAGFGPMRASWKDHAESLLEAPLNMRYTDLDPVAQYKIRVVYGGDSPRKKIRCVANGTIEVHPLIAKKVPYGPVEFDIPAAATKSGELNLSWNREPDLGDNGRGCQVSEIWLIKK